MSWEEVTVGQISSVVTKGTTPTTYGMPFVDEGVNFIKAEALNGDTSLDNSGFVFISEQTHEKLSRSILQKGDVLITIAGANVGRCGIVHDSDLPANTNQAVGIIRVIPEKADPRFVYYHFKLPSTRSHCLSIGGQSAQPNVNLANLKGFKLRLPDLAVQKHVADILSAYDDLIENNRRRITLLERAARELYREWFVRLRFPGHEHTKISDGVPDQWERQTLGVVAENFDRRRVPLSVMEREQRPGPYPYYGAAGILDHIDAYLFDGRYLLMGEDGTVVTSEGTPMLQLVEGQFWVSNHAHVLKGKSVTTEFLNCFLSQYQISGHITGVAQPKITQKNMNRISLLVPPAFLLQEFQETIEPIFNQCFSLRAQYQKLGNARDLLLPRLMDGRISV